MDNGQERNDGTGWDAARDTAKGLGEDVKSAGAEIAREARESALRAAEGGKDNLASRLDHVASALKSSSDELRGSEKWLADAAGAAASRISAASGHLRGEDVNALMREVTEYARAHPATFFGASVALGFAAARIATAHKPASGDSPDTGMGVGS